MNFSLTEKQRSIKDEILAFAKENLNNSVAERDKKQHFDHVGWDLCGQHLLQGLCIPKEFGGAGLDPLSTVLAFEALGEGCEDGGLCFAVAAHLFACTVPIFMYGNESQKKELLPQLCRGELIAANAMTEPQSGSDAFQMTTLASKTKEGNFEINGRKVSVSNGPVADLIITYAMTNKDKGFMGGVTAFLLQPTHHKFICDGPVGKLGVRTCQMGSLTFSKTLVESPGILGKEGAGSIIFSESMLWERICLGAIHLGTMERLLKKTLKFTKQRQAEGQAIHKNQAVSHTLAELKMKLEAARLLTYQSAWKLGQKKSSSLPMHASMSKNMLAGTFQDFMKKIFQIHAGQAFCGDNDIERSLRDAMAATIYSGTTEVQYNIIAKWMGM